MTQFTHNHEFAIDSGNLYVKDSSKVVRGHTVDTSTVKRFSLPGASTRTPFYLVKSNQKYFKDCLETAEDLICNVYPSSVPSTIRSKVARLGSNFGDTEVANIQAARDYKTHHDAHADKKADPGVGQAYVIVSLSTTTEYPYHAGAVIAVDGNDRVTLEVFAAHQHATSRTETGLYNIYSVDDTSGRTFHDAWSGNHTLSAGTPVTIVIEKK